MKKIKDYLLEIKKLFIKLYTRFSNYKNNKKWFVLYLCVLTFFLLFFPVIRANWSNVWFFLFWWMLWKSTLVMLLAIIWLFMWNLSISFKGWVTKLCALREDEPLVDFILLWIVASVFMWVMDWTNVAVASGITQKIWFINWWVLIDGLLLLGWLVWSFVSLWKSSQKSTRKTKIVNIVEERHPSETHKSSSQVTHLFDDLKDEE